MTNLRIIPGLLSLAALTIAGCKASSELTSNYTDERLTLEASNGRSIPLRLLTPDGCTKCPLVIFSHGANSTYDRYNKLILPIAEAGYRVAIPNHTDSEDHPRRAEYKGPDWSPTRLEDYTIIAAKYETNHLIAAGHSFGALIAQIAGGTKMPNMPEMDIPQPVAVLAYSPPGPVPNFISSESWQSISVPTLVTTGTTDIVPMMADDWELHLGSYETAPRELAYALIYESMDHYMNGAYGRETDNETAERDRSMTHLVESSLFFIDNVRAGTPLSSAEWETLERRFVEARANHE